MLDLYTTRRSVTCALGRMPINGIGVRVPSGWVIYRPTPSLYKLIRVGDVAAAQDRFFHSATAVLDFLFPAEVA